MWKERMIWTLCALYLGKQFFFEVSRSGFDGYDVLRAGLSKKVSDAL